MKILYSWRCLTAYIEQADKGALSDTEGLAEGSGGCAECPESWKIVAKPEFLREKSQNPPGGGYSTHRTVAKHH